MTSTRRATHSSHPDRLAPFGSCKKQGGPKTGSNPIHYCPYCKGFQKGAPIFSKTAICSEAMCGTVTIQQVGSQNLQLHAVSALPAAVNPCRNCPSSDMVAGFWMQRFWAAFWRRRLLGVAPLLRSKLGVLEVNHCSHPRVSCPRKQTPRPRANQSPERTISGAGALRTL